MSDLVKTTFSPRGGSNNVCSFQDYQAEVEATRRQFEQKHMVNWIVNNVVSSITPKQVRQSLAVTRKPDFGVSDQVQHKLFCAATEDGFKLETSDLKRRGIVLAV